MSFYFTKFSPQNTFLGKVDSKTFKDFILNETRHIRVSTGDDSEFDCRSLSSVPKISFWENLDRKVQIAKGY